MAVSLSMMFGRVGSVVGSVVIGFLIKNHCDFTFVIPTVLMVLSGILAFTIPNISERVKK
jgi:MFS transporter, VNT family, synaptic vesicle glycoprotein 2